MKYSEGTLKDIRGEFAQQVYEFAGLRLDVARRVLERDGRAVSLYPKAFDALTLLIEHRSELLAKDVLLRRLWPNLVVEENSLARVISDLRKALGDAASCVVTVARRGYRFEADVRTFQRPAAGAGAYRRKVLAVLPFSSLAVGESDKLLMFGLADALITRLSRLKETVVRPTTSVARYAESTMPPARIGAELKADFVLCGTVRRSGAQLRLTVQLVDVESEGAMWAGQFDEPMADLFAIEDSVSERVAASLALELTRRERQSLAQRYTSNARAYELFMHGRFFLSRRTGEALRTAIEYYTRAAELDPEFALAHAGVAEASALLSLASATMGAAPPRQTIPAARAAVLRALSIDGGLSEAHSTLAQIKLAFDWDWPAAEEGFLRAIRLNPNNVVAHGFYAMALTSMGRTEAALREVRRACELEPTSLVSRTNVGSILYLARRVEAAIEQLGECVALEPAFAYARYRYGLALEQAGRYEDALAQFDVMLHLPNAEVQGLAARAHALAKLHRRREALDVLARLRALSRSYYVSAYFIAQVQAALGEEDEAFASLETAYEEKPIMIISLMSDPKLDDLRDDRRFHSLVQRVGLWESPSR